MAKVSNCCGAENRLMADFGADYAEAEICPRRKEHCEFVEEEEEEFDLGDLLNDPFTAKFKANSYYNMKDGLTIVSDCGKYTINIKGNSSNKINEIASLVIESINRNNNKNVTNR